MASKGGVSGWELWTFTLGVIAISVIHRVRNSWGANSSVEFSSW